MAWLVGIDEAGYGPNLGPLVMTAVACRVPAATTADLWHLLASGVRRGGERDDGRIVIADSKVVYSTTRGLAPLEKSVLAVLHDGGLFLDLDTLLTRLCPDALPDLAVEPWYQGASALPLECNGDALHHARQRWCVALRTADVQIGYCRSVVVCTPRFNDLTDTCDSKAAALRFGLVQLLGGCVGATAPEPTQVVIDKHGGRNHYAGMLREALPGSGVKACEEGMERSEYRVAGLDRALRVTFMPRADDTSFAVALASMVSKYVREALMREFNAFWQGHVPGLKATAGYPGDAGRFFDEIRPVAVRLGLSERQVWRRR